MSCNHNLLYALGAGSNMQWGATTNVAQFFDSWCTISAQSWQQVPIMKRLLHDRQLGSSSSSSSSSRQASTTPTHHANWHPAVLWRYVDTYCSLHYNVILTSVGERAGVADGKQQLCIMPLPPILWAKGSIMFSTYSSVCACGSTSGGILWPACRRILVLTTLWLNCSTKQHPGEVSSFCQDSFKMYL